MGLHIDELRALAGAASDATRFTITDTRGVVVHVDYTPGTMDSLSLRARYGTREAAPAGYRGVSRAPRAPRPLGIALRRETARHVEYKERGVNREVQTRDDEFDRNVYIDARAADEAILFVLSRAAARAAIVTLLVDMEFVVVVVDDESGDVVAHFATFAGVVPGTSRRMLDAFVTLVLNLPSVDESAVRPGLTGEQLGLLGLAVAAAAGFIVHAGYMVSAAPAACGHATDVGVLLLGHVFHNEYEFQCQPGCCGPPLTGLLVGAPLGVLGGIIVARFFRGRSDSAGARGWAVGLTVAIVVELAMIVAEHWLW
jgi:hypothetical protein